MALTLNAVIADAIVGFQTIPGIDASSLIQAGPVKQTNSDGTIKDIPSQGGGFYCFKMGADTSLDFALLGTKYTLQHHSTAKNENIPAGTFTIAAWKDLGVKTTLDSVQRRLQILGYYNGTVDGSRGEKTERATLNFQADNTLRTDGIAGPNTQNNLDAVCSSADVKTGNIYVVRRCLVRFTRAENADPSKSVGPPEAEAPDPDDRGFKQVATPVGNLSGPVVTVMKKIDAKAKLSKVKLVRECIAKDADLIAESSNTAVFDVTTKGLLPAQRECIIEFNPKAAGTAQLQIKFKSGAKEVVIGNINVIVFDPIRIKVRPVTVTVDGTGPAHTQADYEKCINTAARILWWAGISLALEGWRTKTITSNAAHHYVAGRLSADATHARRPEFNLIMGNADNEGPVEDNKINLLFFNGIDGVEGVTFPACMYPWPNGIAITDSASGDLMTGINIAHELGHFLGLAYLLPAGQADRRYHWEDNPDAKHQRTDIWSIRRLMYGDWPSDTRKSDSWARNVGYGADLSGCMITARNLTNDPTDNECKTSRQWAQDAHFYRP